MKRNSHLDVEVSNTVMKTKLIIIAEDERKRNPPVTGVIYWARIVVKVARWMT